MNDAMTALLNGIIVSIPVAASVYFLMWLVPGVWTARTRHIAWWAVLIVSAILPVIYLPSTAPPQQIDPQPLDSQVMEGAPEDIAAAIGRAAATGSRTPIPANAAQPYFPIRVIARWTEWIALAWIVTSALMLLRLVVSFLLLEQRKQQASRVLGEEEWINRSGLTRRRIHIATSSHISAPLAAGPCCPTILLPKALFSALNDLELNQVLVHEAAHFARRDDYLLMLQRVLEALFVFHPVVRWSAHKIDLEREIACDDLVVERTGHPLHYASCLTRIAEYGSWAGASPAAPAAGNATHLGRRIEMLIQNREQSGSCSSKAGLITAAIVLMLVTGLAFRAPHVVVLAAERPTEVIAVPILPPPSVPSTPVMQPVLVPVPTPIAPAIPNEQNNAVEIPMISVSAWVTDSKDRYVTGLQKEHFRLFENSLEQEILEFSSEDQPVSLAVIYDTAQRIFTESEVATAPTQLGDNDLSFIAVPDSSSWVAAVRQAIDVLMAAANSRRAIVFVTGEAAIDPETERELRGILGPAGVPVVAIGPAIAGPGSPLFQEIAALTGGMHRAIDDGNQRLGTDLTFFFRHRYTVRFRSNTPGANGQFRRLELEVIPPRGVRALTAHHRTGYIQEQR